MIQDYQELYNSKWYDNNGLCPVCKTPYSLGQPQMAHIVEKSKANIKKYGIDVIDHLDNLTLVCSLQCNSSVLIGQAKTQKILDHINKIKEKINENKNRN